MSRIFHVAITCVFIGIVPTLALAQQTTSELAASASDDARVLQSFQNLERAARQIDHYVAYSIIASAGGWLVIDGYGDRPVSNSYVIRNNVDDQGLEVVRAAAVVDRSKTATDAEKSNAEDAVTNMNAVFAASLAIAEILEDGDPGSAAEIYKSSFVEPQEAALRASMTGAFEASTRLNRTILALRLSN